MRFKVIACKVLYREIGLISATCRNFIDITYLRQGYHNEPDKLRAILQHEIDKIESSDDPYTCDTQFKDFDAILLAYGLCSNGIESLSSKKYTIVAPRAHDCITLFLGAKERYREYFDKHPGTYWYTQGWVENTLMPGREYYEKNYNAYLEKYGEENAKYLADTYSDWLYKYNNAAFIDFPGCDSAETKEYTRDNAAYLKWRFDELDGDDSLLRAMLDGRWDEDRFIVVPPGKKIRPTYDDTIVKAE